MFNEMMVAGSGGEIGAKYAHGENETLPSTGTKTLTCGFAPRVIIIKFLKESGKYRYTMVWSEVQNELLTATYVSTIKLSPSDTRYASTCQTISSATYLSSFNVLQDGFSVGTDTAGGSYSTTFDWEAYA